MNIFEHGAFTLRHINITCDSIWGLNHIKCSVVQVFCGKYYMSGSVLVQHSEECKQFSTVQTTTFIQIHKMYKHQGLDFCLKQYSVSKNKIPIF